MKHLWIREETRCTASVPEDDSFTGSDGIVPDQRQKACHGLTGINRVQQNPLCAGYDSTASVIAAVGWPYPGPTSESLMSKAAMVSR